MRMSTDLPKPIGWLILKVAVQPKARSMDWDTLYKHASSATDRFDKLAVRLSEEQASVKARGHMSMKEMLAHLALTDAGFARQFETIRAGKYVKYPVPELFPGDGGRSLDELRGAHREAAERMLEAAREPITTTNKQPHPIFGDIDAREWLLMISLHYTYHAKQFKEIEQSAEYKRVGVKEMVGA